MDYQAIRFEEDEGIVTVTLHRPEALNAWTARMSAELDDAMRRCDEDDAVRAVVVTGAGRAFCAGQDLGGGGDTFGGGEGRPAPQAEDEWPPGWPRVLPRTIRKPVIAAINGHCMGVGVTWSMNCDVRIVAEDAKLQFTFVRIGVIAELGAHAIVPRVAGLSNAADLILSGRVVSGREFAARGLASEALPADQVLPNALERAREYRAAAPAAVAISKRLLWEGLTQTPLEVETREMRAYPWVGSQPDAREGVMAMIEKRAPRFRVSPPRDVPGD